MSQIKPLNPIQLSRWFNEKFRDEFLVKSSYDKQAHQQILGLIENGNLSGLIKDMLMTLGEIKDAVEIDRRSPSDNDTLQEELKYLMAEKKLSIHNVAKLIKRDPKTVFQFLHQIVKPHDRTVYEIRKLVDAHRGGLNEIHR